MSRRHSLHPLSLEERVWFVQTVGLLTSRVVLGPSSQTVHQFSDMVGVVSDYSGGAVPLTSSNIEYSIKLRSSRNDVATCHFIPFASCCGPQYNEFAALCQTNIDDQITQVALCCPAPSSRDFSRWATSWATKGNEPRATKTAQVFQSWKACAA